MRLTDITMEPKESLRDYIFPIQPKLVVNHILNTMSNLKIGPSNRSLKSVSLWLLKNVFWLVIYLLGSYLTIKSCLSLLKDYSSNPVLTHVTANMTKTVPLPNITVCVPFNAEQMFPLTSSSATPYTDSIKDFFNKTIENGQFDTTNYTEEWKNYKSTKMIPQKETLFILHKYLAIMYEAEYLREDMENPFTNFSWKVESDQEKALLNILMPRIEHMNITIDEIRKIFIEFFKIGSTDYYGLSEGGVLFCIVRGSDDNQCDFFDAISYLDQNQICFKMHNIILQANDPVLNFIMVFINDPSEAIKNSGRKIIFTFDEDAPPIDFVATADESSIIEITPGAYKEIDIDSESIFHGLPVISDGQLRCSYPNSQECEKTCRIGLIKAICGCTPATFTTGHSDENKCTFGHYEKCLGYFGNEDEECRKNCPVSCEQTNYKIDEPMTINYDSGPTSVTISCKKKDNLIYAEKLKWTILDLITAIGGAQGIWLGIDFIVMIRFIFALVAKVFFKMLSMAKREAANSEDDQFNFSELVIKKLFTALNIEDPPSRFTLVSLAMWSIGKFLWAIIYLGGGVFTAIFCFELCKQYASGDLKTSMHISFNNSILLPPATLCIHPNMSYYNINPSFAPSTNYTDALSDYLNQKSISKESILQYGGDGSRWPHIMVYVVYKYLNVLYYYEHDAEYVSIDRSHYSINEWQKSLLQDLRRYCCSSTEPANLNYSLGLTLEYDGDKDRTPLFFDHNSRNT